MLLTTLTKIISIAKINTMLVSTLYEANDTTPPYFVVILNGSCVMDVNI